MSPPTTDRAAPAATPAVLPLGDLPRHAAGARYHLLLQDGAVWPMPTAGELPDSRPDSARGSAPDRPARRPSSWADWCATHPGARVRLLLGTQHLLAVPLHPAPALRAAAAWRQQALSQWQPLHGQDATRWPLAQWHSAAGRGALALLPLPSPAAGAEADQAPGAAPAGHATLWSTAAQHGVQLLAVQPAWWWAVQAAVQAQPALRQADQALLWLTEPGAATAVALRHGAVSGLLLRRQPLPSIETADDGGSTAGTTANTTANITAGTTANTTASDAHTAADRWRADADAACQALGLPTAGLQQRAALWPLARSAWPAPAWRSALAPDFAGPLRPRRLAWAALAVATATVLLAGVEAQQAWQAQQDAADRLASLQQPAADAAPPVGLLASAAAGPAPTAGLTAGPSPGSPPSHATAEAEAALAAAQAAQAAQAALTLPWGALLASTEAASLPGLRWTQLEQAGNRLRLEGLAPDLDRALLAAARLGRQPGLRQVVLARLQQPASADPAPAGPAGLPVPSASTQPASIHPISAQPASAQQFELQARWPGAPAVAP